MRYRKLITVVFAFTLLSVILSAHAAYKYRDANGQWVYTDQPPPSTTPVDTFNLVREKGALHIAVDREESAQSLRLVAANDCQCVVTFKLSVFNPEVWNTDEPKVFRATLNPGDRQTLVEIMRGELASKAFKYSWTAALGSPDARHNPERSYRAPFSIGSTYQITQAYPARITHTTLGSQYAVDIALPDGTPVYAAREGIVINARHDFFRDALDPVMLDQANVVEILHNDGTIALYAHLHWDSIRVRIGDQVVRGQYIANSGNTGFTSGPHLHFAVIRNGGDEEISVPIQFTGIGGIAVSPVTGMPLTAY